MKFNKIIPNLPDAIGGTTQQDLWLINTLQILQTILVFQITS